jgi:zinc transport system permease protein
MLGTLTTTTAVATLSLVTSGATDLLDSLVELFLDDVWGTALDVLAAVTGIEMLSYPFMQRAYLAAVCIAVIGPLVGSFLVHREMAMIGDTLAHSAFAGVAAGLFVNSVFAVTVPPVPVKVYRLAISRAPFSVMSASPSISMFRRVPL